MHDIPLMASCPHDLKLRDGKRWHALFLRVSVQLSPGIAPWPELWHILQLNGQNYGPFQLTQSGASQSSYSGVVTAPAQTGNYQVSVSYLSDIGNYDQTSPYNVPLGVTPASTTVTQTLTPGASGSSSSGSSQAANSGTGSQVTVAGTVQGSNGATPSGTIETTVSTHFSILFTFAPDMQASSAWACNLMTLRLAE